MAYYSIDDGTGNNVAQGISTLAHARRIASERADRDGEACLIYVDGTDDHDEVVEPVDLSYAALVTLRRLADEAGDAEQVQVADRAIAGDLNAIVECGRVVRTAQAQEGRPVPSKTR